MRRNAIRDRVNERQRRLQEADYWDRRINIAHRDINRKKYYGVGTEITNYIDEAEQALNVEDAIQLLRAREEAVTEDLATDIAQAVTINKLTGQKYEAVAALFSDSFKKGTRRLFTKDGDRVDVDEFVDQSVIDDIMRDQDDYWQNMKQDLQNKVRNEVARGVEEGESIRKIRKRVEQTSSDFTRNRAETIARSEVIKASSEGTTSTMERAGIDKFIWLSARNNDVCTGRDAGDPPSFETNIGGTTYTSCRELDGETFDRQGIHPIPVQDTHPNCRCTIVADV